MFLFVSTCLKNTISCCCVSLWNFYSFLLLFRMCVRIVFVCGCILSILQKIFSILCVWRKERRKRSWLWLEIGNKVNCENKTTKQISVSSENDGGNKRIDSTVNIEIENPLEKTRLKFKIQLILKCFVICLTVPVCKKERNHHLCKQCNQFFFVKNIIV